MDSYKIGFYNPKVEDDEGLEECDKIFNNFDDLKFHIREKDEIIIKSGFSLYEINIKEMLDLIDRFDLNIHLNQKVSSLESTNILSIQMLMGINEYIKNNLDIIKKLK